jgi:hypothetical protein
MSGTMKRIGRITRRGSTLLRGMLVEVAWMVWRQAPEKGQEVDSEVSNECYPRGKLFAEFAKQGARMPETNDLFFRAFKTILTEVFHGPPGEMFARASDASRSREGRWRSCIRSTGIRFMPSPSPRGKVRPARSSR